jgi:hypothetical protein
LLSTAGTRFSVRIDPTNPRVLALSTRLNATPNLSSDAQPEVGKTASLAHVKPGQFVLVGTPGTVLTRADAIGLLVDDGSGQQAEAVVLSARDAAPPLGAPSMPGGWLDLTLEIARADGSNYSTVMRCPIATPAYRRLLSTAGTRFNVRINPANPNVLAADKSSLPDVEAENHAE